MKIEQVCTRCVMDTSARGIVFDENGICNYCKDFLKNFDQVLSADENVRAHKQREFIARVKESGRGKRYDCIVGLSGGVDSSWALCLAVKNGLRPLAVHMDNGWDTELAHNNISKIVTKLKVDLYTHVIDWCEYRGLMQAFFDTDVIDIELLYDNAMLAVNYKQAESFKIKYILSGHNASTEGMSIPENWNWFKYDKRNIYSINKHHDRRNVLRTFPAIGTLDYVWYEYVKKIKWVNFLDYFCYDKKSALEIMVKEYGYKPYAYKHYESVFTRFYQGYILPVKFGVDKRKLHCSTLIMSGQMKREDAVCLLEKIPYPTNADLDNDIYYFLKKMEWSLEDLQEYMQREELSHMRYGSEKKLWDILSKIYKAAICSGHSHSKS